MKVLLLEIHGPGSESVCKDFAGGLGPGFHPGESFRARLLNRAKRAFIRLPTTTFGYLSAIFAAEGHEVLFRVNAEVPSDLVLIQSSLTDFKAELSAARRIKAAGKGKVGFLGLLSGTDPESFLESADFVVKGEPEGLMREVARGAAIPSGVVTSEPVKDLESLPFPDWTPFPVSSYRYFPSLTGWPVLPVLATRGCVYSCNYCPYIAQYRDWRTRDVGNVVDELEHMVRRYGVRDFLFRDPLFSYPESRAREFAREVRRRDLRISFTCETRVDCLTPELLGELRAAGLRTVNIGIETLDKTVLKMAQRTDIPVERQREIIDACHRLGVNVTAFYMLGYPGDTPENVERTMAYARDLNTLVAAFTVFTPFQGVAAEKLVADRIVERDWSKYDSFHLVFHHDSFTAAELAAAREKAFTSYYFRPAYAARLFKSLWTAATA